jgi:sulfur-oxidizing protein SoxY
MTRRAFAVRRRVVLGGLALAPSAWADDTALNKAMRAEIGDKTPIPGPITLRLPATAENGGQVPVVVMVENPMTQADHVTAIHLFATRNPTPDVASFTLSPALGRAELHTRIRLAEGQTVIALAVMSDGRVLRADARAEVTEGGCVS